MTQDLRLAWRQIVRHPGVTLVAVLSLALGTGANTTVFTLLNATLLHPLPVRDIEELVSIGTVEDRATGPVTLVNISRLNGEDLRGAAVGIQGPALVGSTNVTLSGSGQPEVLSAQLVTHDFFDILGVRAEIGRVIGSAGAGADAVRSAVLSYAFWQRRYSGDPAVLGSRMFLNGEPVMVIGVMPRGFRGLSPVGGPDIWVPLAMHRELLTGVATEAYASRRALAYQAVARLGDGVTLQQAQANAAAISPSLATTFPRDNAGRTLSLRPLAEGLLPEAFKRQLTLAGAVGVTIVALVLLIACANVANLLLARATARKQEMAVRLSLGASRWRILAQLLTESGILALFGGIGGLLVAYAARQTLWAMRPPFMPEHFIDLDLDPRVFGFTLAVSIVSAIVFGLAPALRLSRSDLVTELRQRSADGAGSRWYAARNLLVAGQVALTLVALIGAGLFIRSVANAQRIDVGFETRGLVIFGVNPGNQRLDAARGLDLYRRVAGRLGSLPAVESVTVSSGVPLFAGNLSRPVERDDQPAPDGKSSRPVPVGQVAAGYFEAMGIPIFRGRPFTERDREGAMPVVILNDAAARQLFGEADPIGRRVTIAGRAPSREVVGVARTVKYGSLGEPDVAQVYVPLEQDYAAQVFVQVRTSGHAGAMAGTIRRELQVLEPAMPLLAVNTYEDVLSGALWIPRFGASILAVFAALALLLASAGLYGLMSYNIAQRRREIGIRMAIGARHGAIRRMLIAQGVSLAVAGAVSGALVGAAASRVVTGLLYGVEPLDGFTFIGAPALLLLTAVVASAVPAWRASRVSPGEALRP